MQNAKEHAHKSNKSDFSDALNRIQRYCTATDCWCKRIGHNDKRLDITQVFFDGDE